MTGLFSQFSQEDFEYIVYKLTDILQYNTEFITNSGDYWISNLSDSYLSPKDGALNIVILLIPAGQKLSEANYYKFMHIKTHKNGLTNDQIIVHMIMEVSNRLALC